MSTSDLDRAAVDQRLRLLEADFARANERFREAKQAAKQAKQDAKRAKKNRKRARLALIEAQEAYDVQTEQGSSSSAVNEREYDTKESQARHVRGVIPDSPERKRTVRRRKKVASTVIETPAEAKPSRSRGDRGSAPESKKDAGTS
jgi:hypothetical protein